MKTGAFLKRKPRLLSFCEQTYKLNRNYNLKLSKKRAKVVIKYLVKKGINKKQFVAVGYGASQPFASNDTESGRQLNRRTEFKIVGYLNTKSLDEIEIIRNDEEEGVKEEVKIKNEKEIIRKQIREKEKLQNKEIIKQD